MTWSELFKIESMIPATEYNPPTMAHTFVAKCPNELEEGKRNETKMIDYEFINKKYLTHLIKIIY